LLVPEHTDIGIGMHTEFNFKHKILQAAARQLHLNPNKTKEMVFSLPRIKYFHLPPAVHEIEHVVGCCFSS